MYAALLFMCLIIELVSFMQSQAFFSNTSIKLMQKMSKTNGQANINYTPSTNIYTWHR